MTEETARAIAYQASLKRRAAAQKGFAARLVGSLSAYKNLLLDWKPIIIRRHDHEQERHR